MINIKILISLNFLIFEINFIDTFSSEFATTTSPTSFVTPFTYTNQHMHYITQRYLLTPLPSCLSTINNHFTYQKGINLNLESSQLLKSNNKLYGFN